MKPAILAAALLALAMPGAAQPRLENARLTERTLGGSLEATIRLLAAGSTEPSWAAWPAPVADGGSRLCCGDWGGSAAFAQAGRCRLEPGSTTTTLTRRSDRAVPLEAAETFFVFVRLADRQIERVRIFSEDCAIDAAGAAVTRLTSVRPEESVAFLASLVADSASTRRTARGALTALAQHGLPEAVTRLVRLARESADASVRGEALFWLSQRAGARAAAAITDAVDHDPETEVKKRAVFALSQLPPDEGVPKLIAVARSHRNPAVRKQAIFWLGQSKDPRAIAFFEEVLR